jgi:hypothetical protein
LSCELSTREQDDARSNVKSSGISIYGGGLGIAAVFTGE